jgi:HSF-type DNA-binding
VQWTLEGDAFVVGPNLKRLEAETLPQFFRHNRFQSFVRQLNFYSFRKINRERTMWVYKHDLFRRDHPEDLPLLRRRTCPTIDGRRQTLPRPLLKKATSSAVSNTKANDGTVRKRRPQPQVFSRNVNPTLNRPSIDWTTSAPAEDPILHANPHVLNSVPLTESEDSDDQAFLGSSSSLGLEDQSTVVLKIASQLAQHARNSCIGSRISGLVTPPFASSRRCSRFSGTLLTYDDEHERINGIYDHESPIKQRSVSNEKLSQMDRLCDPSFKRTALSHSKAQAVVERLLDTVHEQDRGPLSSSAKVACFCIVTLPSSVETNFFAAICDILLQCSHLQREFQLYRLALRPVALLSCSPSPALDQDESCEDTIRSFSVFAVNKMQLLSQSVIESLLDSGSDDILILEQAISVWQKVGEIYG